MNDELGNPHEGKADAIIDLIGRAMAKVTHLTEAEPHKQAHDELWIAATWINKLDDATKLEVVPEILGRDDGTSLFFVLTLLNALAILDKKIEDIEDGISWESQDGLVMRAFEVNVFESLVQRTEDA